MKKRFMKTTVLSMIVNLLSLSIVYCQELPVKKASMKLSDNRAIEIAFSTIKEGKENQLFQEYFPKIMPIITEYDGHLLNAFKNQTLSGAIEAQNVVFFEWPSVSVFVKIGKDTRVPELLKIRNDALDYINEANFFRINNSKEIIFLSDKIYTLIGDKDSNVGTEKKFKEYQGETMAVLLSDESSFGSFNPKQFFIVEWTNEETLNSYLDMIKSKKDKPYIFKLYPDYK